MPFGIPRRLSRILLVPLATALLASVLIALPAPSAEARPKLNVSILASGLSNPWDVTWVGDVLLFNERGGKVWSKRSGATRRAVSAPLSDLFVNSEGGLMGMVADPAAASKGQAELGGVATNATVSSLGNGTLDVFALRNDGRAFRKRYNGTTWSAGRSCPVRGSHPDSGPRRSHRRAPR